MIEMTTGRVDESWRNMLIMNTIKSGLRKIINVTDDPIP
jgi:hypothetical protein